MAVRKTYNQRLESRVIQAITSGNSNGLQLLSKIAPDHFRDETNSTAFHRIQTLIKSRSHIIHWNDLIDDPGLDDLTRNALRQFGVANPLPSHYTKEAIETLFRSLDNWRRRRVWIRFHNEMGAALEREDLDIDVFENNTREKFGQIGPATTDVEMTHIGMGDNASEMVNKIIDGTAVQYIPTGFDAYDNTCKGLELGTFMVLAATTGGGKSAVAKTLAENFARAGANTAIIPLEMRTDGVLIRNLTANANIPMLKLRDPQQRMTEEEKDKIYQAYYDMSAEIRSKRARLTFMEFKSAVSLIQILLQCKTLGYKIIIIDYLGLVEGTDGDDQVKALGRLSRLCQTWAITNNILIIAAAQLKEDGEIKYSKAILENAPNSWTWVYDQASKENKILRIVQPKARQSDNFTFYLYFDPVTMLIRDLTKDERDQMTGGGVSKQQSSGRGSKGGPNTRQGQKRPPKSEQYFADLNEV